MTTDRDLAFAFLRADPLRYLMHLKYLRLHPDGVACRYVERNGAAGVLLCYRPALMTWDQQAYPGAEWIILPAAESTPPAEALCQAAAVRAGPGAFALKTCDPLTRAV